MERLIKLPKTIEKFGAKLCSTQQSSSGRSVRKNGSQVGYRVGKVDWNKKGLRRKPPKSLIYLVAGTGFEPVTFGL